MMSCKHEGSTHFACDCVLAQLRAADELAKAARHFSNLLAHEGAAILPHLLDTDENAGQRFRDALAAYESARGK